MEEIRREIKISDLTPKNFAELKENGIVPVSVPNDATYILEIKQIAENIESETIQNKFSLNMENFPLSMGVACGLLSQGVPISMHSTANQPAYAPSSWIIAPFTTEVSRLRIMLSGLPAGGATSNLDFWIVEIPDMVYNSGTPARAIRRIRRQQNNIQIKQGLCAIDLTETEKFRVRQDTAYCLFVVSPDSNAWLGVGRQSPNNITGMPDSPRMIVSVLNLHGLAVPTADNPTDLMLIDGNYYGNWGVLWWAFTTTV